MKVALEKYGHKTSAAVRKGQTMKNTMGRDDAMYYISDNLNLRKEDDNQFNALMSINNFQTAAAQSSMSQQINHYSSLVGSQSGMLGANRSNP